MTLPANALVEMLRRTRLLSGYNSKEQLYQAMQRAHEIAANSIESQAAEITRLTAELESAKQMNADPQKAAKESLEFHHNPR